MGIDLLKTYEDMINGDKTNQEQLNSYYNAIYMDYFVRPDLRINQRAGHKSNGEFIEGLHIYPDKECICEILKLVQDKLNGNLNILNKLKNNKLSALLYISELVNYYINNYFGSTENIEENSKVYHYGINNSSEYMANLSDFKNKNSAICIERALATYIVLSVILNNQELGSSFKYKPFLSIINICRDITDEKSGSSGHALCGLISQDSKEAYLLDSINYGLVKDIDGKKQYVYGLYELNEEEFELMFNGEAIEPQLFRCKHIDGTTQLSHRAFSKKSQAFEILKRKNEGRHR